MCKKKTYITSYDNNKIWHYLLEEVKYTAVLFKCYQGISKKLKDIHSVYQISDRMIIILNELLANEEVLRDAVNPLWKAIVQGSNLSFIPLCDLKLIIYLEL